MEHLHHLGRLLNERTRLLLMDDNVCTRKFFHSPVAHYVIYMRMGIDDVFYGVTPAFSFFENPVLLCGRINDKRFICNLTCNDIRENGKTANLNLFYEHNFLLM